MEQLREWWQTILEVCAGWLSHISAHPAIAWAWGWLVYGWQVFSARFMEVPAAGRWGGLVVIIIVVGLRACWVWARRAVMRHHLDVQVELWRAVLALIHAGRDVDMRGMGPVDMARRELKTAFFRNQIFIATDVAVRKEMRQLLEVVDADAARFVQRPEFGNVYRLQTLVEAQIRQQPGWVRNLQWVTSDVWYALWRRRRQR